MTPEGKVDRPLVAPDPPPYDPDSEVGRRVAEGLSEVFGDVLLRMLREGLPIPDLYGDCVPGCTCTWCTHNRERGDAST